MRVKEQKMVVTFQTTVQAMKMETQARADGIPGRLIPVPRQISAGCGMAWCTPIEERRKTETFMENHEIIWEGIYELCL